MHWMFKIEMVIRVIWSVVWIGFIAVAVMISVEISEWAGVAAFFALLVVERLLYKAWGRMKRLLYPPPKTAAVLMIESMIGDINEK